MTANRYAGLRGGLTAPSARRWPCPGQDVPSRVHVSIEDETAVGAFVDADRERLPLRRFASAAGADLGRSAWVHRDHDAPGAFSLGGQDREELAPAGVMHTLGEAHAGEAADVQVFDCDCVVPAHEVERRLEVVVAPDACGLSLDGRHEIREGGEPTPHEQPNATVPQLESDRREDVTPSNGDRK